MTKPGSVFDRAALNIAERSYDAAERELNRARGALALTGALETRRDSSAPAVPLSPRLEAYRARLLDSGMASELIDINLDQLLSIGRAQHARHAQLREELAQVDAAIATFNEATREILAPLEATVTALANQTTAAVQDLDQARTSRQSELMCGLEAQRSAIMGELQKPHAPGFRLDDWREWKEGEPKIAPMHRPGSDAD